MNAAPKLTLDNNCVISIHDHRSATATYVDELYEIVRLALSGAAEIAVTTRVEADLSNDRDEPRRTEMMRRALMFPVVGTVFRWGHSRWGEGDLWSGTDGARLAEDLQKLLFPGGLDPAAPAYGNKVNDVDHLIGHLINGRDVFVTADRGILKKAEALRASPGIVVMSPTECLAFLERQREDLALAPLASDGTPAAYRSVAHSGTVTFDYSNNDGRFAIGDGVFLFETMWSKASDVSIRAYSDPASIDGVAIAKGAQGISEVGDASALDYSSRSRTVGKGQVLVLRNVNGIYAAIKVLDVRDESRLDERDELTFEYVIGSEGQRGFS